MYLYTILKGTVPEIKRMASNQTVHHTYERVLQSNFYSAQMSQEYIITNDTKLKTMTMTKRNIFLQSDGTHNGASHVRRSYAKE